MKKQGSRKKKPGATESSKQASRVALGLYQRVANAERKYRGKCSQPSVLAAGHAPHNHSTTTPQLCMWNYRREGEGNKVCHTKITIISFSRFRRSNVALFEPVHGELPIRMERSYQVHGGAHTNQTAWHDFLMDDGEVSTRGRHDNHL